VSKLTKWYPANVKPIRKGVYERDMTSPGKNGSLYWAFSFWDGRFWYAGSIAPELNTGTRVGKHAFQNLPWRGLAAPK
jgi:hypothetical protein